MKQLMTDNTVRFAGASKVERVDDSAFVVFKPPIVFNPPPSLPPPPPPPESLPLMSSRVGNLFIDRNDAKLHWYLPDFALADDIDPGFAFTASQSGQDSDGHPFNAAKLTLRLHKSMPDDAVKFSQDNPSAKLQEIPLAEMSVLLTSFYTDDNGQELQRTFSASFMEVGDSFSQLIFDGTILGKSVIGLYQDLRLFGKAVIKLSASYQVWSQPQTVFLPGVLMRPLVLRAADSSANEIRAEIGADTVKGRVVAAPFFRSQSFAPEPALRAQPAEANLVQTRQGWEKRLPLGLKYNQDGYQLEYTVSTATITKHVIRDVDDLQEFSLSQSEFTELKALGDISARYPSLSRAYIGVLSRSIVVIPQRYSIIRNHVGCAALCMALVDSAATDGSKCKFEFDFAIAPEVSRIEFLKLAEEVSSRAELKGYTLKLPEFLHDAPPSTLQTAFKSSVQFAAGTDTHTFAVTVVIHDVGAQTPAVANANLFIMRLCSGTGAELVGSLSLKLDDGYADPVLSPIVLNFSHTSGTDEVKVEIDEVSAQINLTNRSPLDLQFSRYALVKGSTLTEFPDTLTLPANSSSFVPLPVDHSGLKFAADSQLVVPTRMTKSDIAKFLQFQTMDVQETQYVVAVDSSGVDFKRIDSIVASVTFGTLPSVVPRPLNLNKNLRADSTHIVIPLENAVFSLPGTVNLAVRFVDPGISNLSFTIENDFTSEPVLILLQSDIEKALSKP